MKAKLILIILLLACTSPERKTSAAPPDSEPSPAAKPAPSPKPAVVEWPAALWQKPWKIDVRVVGGAFEPPEQSATLHFSEDHTVVATLVGSGEKVPGVWRAHEGPTKKWNLFASFELACEPPVPCGTLLVRGTTETPGKVTGKVTEIMDSETDDQLHRYVRGKFTMAAQ